MGMKFRVKPGDKIRVGKKGCIRVGFCPGQGRSLTFEIPDELKGRVWIIRRRKTKGNSA